MAIDVETKDCTALSDAELAEMADMCAEGPTATRSGLLSKQAEAWVLITLAREDGKLKGFSFCTLERIGGTPSVLIGVGVGEAHRQARHRAARLITEQLRRALLAFPDEDVLVGTRFATPAGFEAFQALTDIVPRPDHKATGEERAWGRRLAKRFGVDAPPTTSTPSWPAPTRSHPRCSRPRRAQAREGRRGRSRCCSPTSIPTRAACSWRSAGRWPTTSSSSAAEPHPRLVGPERRASAAGGCSATSTRARCRPRSSTPCSTRPAAPRRPATPRARPSWSSKGPRRRPATGT